jgi:hypothetical protein
LFLLDFQDRDGFLEEKLEVDDVFLVVSKRISLLILINIEVKPVALKDLHWCESSLALENLFNITLIAGKNFEFF